MNTSLVDYNLPKIESALIKKDEFTLEYLSEKYVITVQFLDDDIIVISANRIDKLASFEVEMKLKDMKNLGKLFLLYDTTEEVYNFLVDSFEGRKKNIFIKEVIEGNSLTLSIEYKIPGNKLISNDIKLPEKKCNPDELIKNLYKERDFLKESNRKLEGDNKILEEEIRMVKEELEKIKEDYEKMKEEYEKIKDENELKRILLHKNNKINTNRKIYDKIFYYKDNKTIESIYTRDINKFGKNYYSLSLSSYYFKPVPSSFNKNPFNFNFLIGYDNENYYLFKFQYYHSYYIVDNINEYYKHKQEKKKTYSIKFPIEFQFCYSNRRTKIYNTNNDINYDDYSIGSIEYDKILVKSCILDGYREKTITMSDLTVLPKNAYYIVLPDTL